MENKVNNEKKPMPIPVKKTFNPFSTNSNVKKGFGTGFKGNFTRPKRSNRGV